VLGFAFKDINGKTAETELTFVGLQAMIDPPRTEVKKAIAKCQSAGIKVIMVTGDYIETAKAIGAALGIEGKAASGAELEGMRESDIKDYSIFARVNPEHKIKIVEALQKDGHIVAMTGDGVNDAPALKKAHMGIAMGIKGTDVAKESSDMILTDDNFASIVNAVEEGRGIYDNIRKFVNYLLSTNLGELMVLFLALLLFRDSGGNILFPLIAVQILFINLVTDGLPAIALGVDPIDPMVMSRKPRNPKESIMSHNMRYSILAIGVLVCIGTLFMFNYGLAESETKARTLAFTTLVFLEIARVQLIRNQYHTRLFSNRFLLIAITASLAMQLAVIYTPLNGVFKTMPLHGYEFVIILTVCVAVYVVGMFVTRLIARATHQLD
jgi:Ca2+-transporting ATPase